MGCSALGVDAGWRTPCFEAVNLHFCRRVLVPARLGPQRLAMATVAIRLTAKKFIAAFSSIRIKVNPRPRFQGRQRQLIKL